MAIEKLSVTGIQAGQLRVSTRQQPYCERCHANAGCGLHLLQKGQSAIGLSRQEELTLPMPYALQGKIQTGSQVMVAIDDKKLMSLSFLQYLLPLALMLTATMAAEKVTTAIHVTELWVVLSAMTGLFTGLLLVHRHSQLYSLKFTEMLVAADNRDN